MGVTSELDKEIGQRLRKVRVSNDHTQSDLADALGISFQQVQKYENGSNRVSSTRLYDIAATYDIPITYFFEDLRENENKNVDTEVTDRVLRVARIFNQIPDGIVKDSIFTLIKAHAKAED
jgi:transcriptional regulator with XRE-family HTH domain